MDIPNRISVSSLKMDNKLLSHIIGRNADGIVIVDKNGIVLFANPAAEDFFQQKVKVFLGKPFGFPLPAGNTTELVLTCRSGRSTTAEMRAVEMDWETEKVYLIYFRNCSEDDSPLPPLQMTALGQNVKERLQDNSGGDKAGYRERGEKPKEIEEEDVNLSLFPDENPDPIFRIGRDGRILYCNTPAKHLLNLRSGSDGKTLPEQLVEFMSGMEGTQSRGNIELQIQDKIFDFHMVSIQDTGFINVYGRDITDTKNLEQQFYQSQKMEAVGRLAGGIAHDFNNMMTVVTGYSDSLLSDLDENDQLYASIKEISKAGKKASSLTHQLLAFSRKQVLKPRVLDLNSVLVNIESMIRHLAGEDVDVVFIPDPELGRVKADAGQIDQVIINLVVNARDAMPVGGKLTIETVNTELSTDYARDHIAVKPGLYVMLSVSDTGTGMSEETKSKIFDPFFTTKEHGKGTGLGLSTVYGIVKQSGGNIWTYSESGKGTSFKIYLPRVDEVEEVAKQSKAAPGSLNGGEKILLVEDEEMVRHFTHRILEEKGYLVFDASSGDEALRICQNKKNEIGLIITDVVLPGIGGRELAAQIALLQPAAKMLFMSGYANKSIVRHGILAPGTNFLQKPFTIDSLLRKVRDILDESNTGC
jgi:signal transduction histidine kinase/ActR/RegA family two-component response regulator